MSWDAWIFKLKGAEPRTEAEWQQMQALVQPLGSDAQVRNLISAAVEGVNWDEPRLGWVNRDNFTMWLTLSPAEQNAADIDSISVAVHGNGDPLLLLRDISVPNGLAVFDLSTGDWVDWTNDPGAGFESWAAYRDRVFEQMGAELLLPARLEQDKGG